MSRYTITESVGSHVEPVHRYEDLAKHHPSSGREPGREYATLDGHMEEVRHVGGHTYVKKDMILAVDTGGPVDIPAPANGYVHYLHDPTNAVRIYDRPFSQPGATLLAQVLHMRPGTSPPEGSRVDYGAPLGRMGDTGTPGSIHAHIEMEPGAFRRYIQDIERGAITPDRHPAGPNPSQPAAVDVMADGVLRRGEQGTPVRSLQQRLNALGVRDAQGRAIPVDGDFGQRTEDAVRNFQRVQRIGVDGVAGPDTFTALERAAQPSPHRPAAGHYGPTPLSNLIGRGEGDYDSFNRGRAGDAGATVAISQLTVGEVMRQQSLPAGDPRRLFAVGKFQMVPGTMRDAVEHLHIDRDARFTPELQERVFAEYLVSDKRPAVRAYVTGAGGAQALDEAQLALAREFASVADPRTGRGYYDGDAAGNHASISARETQQALDRMRELYRANVARGMSPSDAYTGIGGGAPMQGTESPRSTPAPTAIHEQDDRVRGRAHGHGAREPSAPKARSLLTDPAQGDPARTRRAQSALAHLGYTGADGRLIDVDGALGPNSRHGLQQFQRDHGLPVTGRLDQGTQDRLVAAERTMASSTHPAHALYRQAFTAVQELDRRLGIPGGPHTAALAGVAAAEAARAGLVRVDRVDIGADRAHVQAVQFLRGVDDGATNRISAAIDVGRAVGQPLETSSRQAAQAIESRAFVAEQHAQQHAPMRRPVL